MSQPQVAPYGSWKSPITSDLIVTATVGLGQIALDGEDVYWVELRPSEGGAQLCRSPHARRDGLGRDARRASTRAHAYTSTAAATSPCATVWSTSQTSPTSASTASVAGVAPQPITPEQSYRYSDFVVDARRLLLFAVREDHTVEGREAVNTLVCLDTDGTNEDGGRVLVSGNDFYSSPRLSPDGSRLAWLTWNHPNMPWDGSELWVGELDEDGTIRDSRRVAGGRG